MRKLYTIILIALLVTSSLADDLAKSFKEAVELATVHEDRAARIYAAIDLKDYYQGKYFPVFQSCLKSTEHPDTSPFSVCSLLYAG